MKGQLFTMDVLASVLIVTIIVAFTTWEFEQVYSRAPDVQYEKLNSLAGDIAQMAVKNILVYNNASVLKSANFVNESRWSLLTGNMSEMIVPPTAYEAKIIGTSLDTLGNGGCSSKTSVAVARRIVYDSGVARELNIEVCA